MVTNLDNVKLAASHGLKYLAAAVFPILAMWFMLGRRRNIYPHGLHVIGSYECCAAGCDETVGPRTILCTKHNAQVPVPIRMALARETRPGPKQTRAWGKLAYRAVLATGHVNYRPRRFAP